MNQRGSGILLHLSSLPSAFGIGDMGPAAYAFADFLAETKQAYWQILPLTPTDAFYGSSPYHSCSAFAGNPLFISPDLLVHQGLLASEDLEPTPIFPMEQADYAGALAYKTRLFERAFNRFSERRDHNYERFCQLFHSWLDDFSLFVALKSRYQNTPWSDWPTPLRDRAPEALSAVRQELEASIVFVKFIQYLFFTQWFNLKDYCNQRGIRIFGDIPIYVNHDSADVWVNPDLFKLDSDKRPYVVAGVPPDYFSATGQRWGNPVYNWDVHKARRYDWWAERIHHNLTLFDLARIDHFRGLIAYWEVPASEPTAINGTWVKAPALDFLSHLVRRFSVLPLVAEDLGIITAEVREVMHHFNLPGMKILLFAFGGDLPSNPYIPHNLPRNCVAYTGTHDNNTTRGWFENELTPEDRQRVAKYLGRELSPETISAELIRVLMMSVADTVIIPMQDLLGLGQEARMNTPATTQGNWQWRLRTDQITAALRQNLREMTEMYGRA